MLSKIHLIVHGKQFTITENGNTTNIVNFEGSALVMTPESLHIDENLNKSAPTNGCTFQSFHLHREERSSKDADNISETYTQ